MFISNSKTLLLGSLNSKLKNLAYILYNYTESIPRISGL